MNGAILQGASEQQVKKKKPMSYNLCCKQRTTELNAEVLPTSTFFLQFLDLDHHLQTRMRKPIRQTFIKSKDHSKSRKQSVKHQTCCNLLHTDPIKLILSSSSSVRARFLL